MPCAILWGIVIHDRMHREGRDVPGLPALKRTSEGSPAPQAHCLLRPALHLVLPPLPQGVLDGIAERGAEVLPPTRPTLRAGWTRRESYPTTEST